MGVPNFGSKTWAGECYQNHCPYHQGSYGGWWASTADAGNLAYALLSRSSEFRSTANNKGEGLSVRCVAR